MDRLKAGDRVRSYFRAQWSGVVLSVTPERYRRDDHVLVVVQPDTDRHGNPMHKAAPQTLDIGYLVKLGVPASPACGGKGVK